MYESRFPEAKSPPEGTRQLGIAADGVLQSYSNASGNLGLRGVVAEHLVDRGKLASRLTGVIQVDALLLFTMAELGGFSFHKCSKLFSGNWLRKPFAHDGASPARHPRFGQ